MSLRPGGSVELAGTARTRLADFTTPMSANTAILLHESSGDGAYTDIESVAEHRPGRCRAGSNHVRSR
jgi:hypothetical protein